MGHLRDILTLKELFRIPSHSILLYKRHGGIRMNFMYAPEEMNKFLDSDKNLHIILEYKKSKFVKFNLFYKMSLSINCSSTFEAGY